jgi:hypothetical protein
MANKGYQSQKVSLSYSKTQIEKAGRAIRHGCIGSERDDAILKIQNYRELHLYPLMLVKNHLAKATKRASKRGVVARRLKMLATIIDKLERPSLDGSSDNAIQITRMQDIGGCRAIVPDLDSLTKLHEDLGKSRSVHQIIRTIEYLTPKESGYSGIHLVYSCFAGSDEENEWKKTKIEVQLRTELQHAWATSLEIIDTLEGIKLKTSMEGYPKWRRFFRIAGLLVAHKENCCPIDENEITGLIEELVKLEKHLEVRKKLAHYSLAIRLTTDKSKLPRRIMTHQGMFLVKVHRPEEDENNKFTISTNLVAYSPKDLKIALKELAKCESDSEIMISVLVAAGDARSLKKAYPNYFGSTTLFQEFLTKYIDPEKFKADKLRKKDALKRTSS